MVEAGAGDPPQQVTQTNGGEETATSNEPGSATGKTAGQQGHHGAKEEGHVRCAENFLRQKNICIRWNVGSCSETSDTHPSPDRSAAAPVRHICGGCSFLGKQDDSSHSMKTCRHKNSDGIFR